MAAKVFVNDDILLTLITNKVLTGYTCYIKFERPNGTGGKWAATIHPSITTRLRAPVNFDVSGIWKVQAFITLGGDRYHGAWADIKVYDPISPDTMVPTT
jgi:hypothetical protein